MAVLSQVPLRILIHTTAIEMLVTIFTCYTMAVYDGHVQPWLPTISECGIYPPEKYFFRYGFVVGACLMAIQGVCTYYLLKSWTKSGTYLALVSVASFCLGAVGVVSMHEDSSVHNFMAVVFFLCSDVNMVLTTWHFYERLSMPSFVVKTVLAFVGSSSLIAFHFQEIFSPLVGVSSSIYLAIFEWSNVLTIIFYYWSFSLDMYTLFLALTDSEVSPSSHHKKKTSI